MLINGIKFACNTCVKGHRSSNCNHFDRPLFEIRKKGRPVSQCAFCRDLRKTKQVHIKCTCTDKSKKSKAKNIENTATQCYQSNPLSGINQYNGTYSDRMTQVSHQCTCHETASKLLLYNNALPSNVETNSLLNWQPQHQQQLSTFNRPYGLDDQSDAGYYKSAISPSTSLRFLNGQTKSPRRRSSLTRSPINTTNSRRRSTMSHLSRPVISVEDFDLTDQTTADRNRMAPYSMPDYQQNIDLNSEQHSSLTAPIYSKSSSASIISSSSSIPSPSSTHTDEVNLGNYTNDLGFMATGPDELTNLLNNVLMDNQSSISTLEGSNPYYQIPTATDMTRSTTISSSCSSTSATPMMMPLQSAWCGSLVPHGNCVPSSANQGESVVITITPLQNTKPAVTRIVTCYCGDFCNCPGCFVHPNNLLNQQQPKQYSRSSFSSSSSSSYSSDDEQPR